MTETRSNNTFGRDDPTWANACVGENGQPGYLDYAKGYSQAANLLIDTVIQDEGMNYYVDEFVYPVCFNMRHSVELRLKAAISDLIELELIRGRSLKFDLAGSHDIGNIWDFFVKSSAITDDRYSAVNARLSPLIADIAEIDPTGQTFRYPHDMNENKHLVDVANINFFRLKKAFSTLETALDDLNRLNRYLKDEYSVGKFTKNLSRRNLFQLATMLPQHDEWSDPSFDLKKTEIRAKFSISNKELGKGIDIIKNHFEFSHRIGLSPPLKGVADLDILGQIYCWFLLHRHNLENAAQRWTDSSYVDFQSEIIRDSKAQSDIWNLVKPRLTPAFMSGISALFYFARDLDFSERYINIYDQELREHNAIFKRSTDEVKTTFFHVLDKTNMVENILFSLYFLKKDALAETIFSAYGIERIFPRIEEARNGTRFKKPALYGYEVEELI